MRRGLAITGALLCALAAFADTPLSLMRSATGPKRMYSLDMTGSCELPPYFASGSETGLTVVAWIRFAATPYGGLLCFPSHSTVPARATREGGDELPAFLDLPSVPLSSSATWGASGVVPQDAAEVPGTSDGRFVVCVNCSTSHDLTLTVGGAELNIPATNGFIRNLEVYKGDASVAVAAASPSATVRLALAINPWIEFVGGPVYAPANGQQSTSTITNCWTMLCWRARLADGVISETFDLVGRDGSHHVETSSSAYPAPRLVRDSRWRYSFCSLAFLRGSAARRCDLYGLKRAPHALTDAEVWRVWELDLAEIRRRGLDTPLSQ